MPRRRFALCAVTVLGILAHSDAYFGGNVLKVGCSASPERALAHGNVANHTQRGSALDGMLQTAAWAPAARASLLAAEEGSLRLLAVDLEDPGHPQALGALSNTTAAPRCITTGFQQDTVLYGTADRRIVVAFVPPGGDVDASTPLPVLHVSPQIPADPGVDIRFLSAYPRLSGSPTPTVLAAVGRDIVRWNVYDKAEPLSLLFRHPEDSAILTFASHNQQNLIVLDDNKCLFFVDAAAPPTHRVSCLYMSIDYSFLPQILLNVETSMAFVLERYTKSVLSFSTLDSRMDVVGVYTITHDTEGVSLFASAPGEFLLWGTGGAALSVSTCKMSLEQMLHDLGIEVAMPRHEDEDLREMVEQVAANLQETRVSEPVSAAARPPAPSSHAQPVLVASLLVWTAWLAGLRSA